MWTWLKRIGVALLVIGGGYTAYDWYRAGYHTRPTMPEGAFSISYKNGLRAILIDIENERETRRYFGFPVDVPSYLQEAWSYCYPPTTEDGDYVVSFMERRGPGERFEAVCKIKADDDVVVRGLVTSVPRL